MPRQLLRPYVTCYYEYCQVNKTYLSEKRKSRTPVPDNNAKSKDKTVSSWKTSHGRVNSFPKEPKILRDIKYTTCPHEPNQLNFIAFLSFRNLLHIYTRPPRYLDTNRQSRRQTYMCV